MQTAASRLTECIGGNLMRTKAKCWPGAAGADALDRMRQSAPVNGLCQRPLYLDIFGSRFT